MDGRGRCRRRRSSPGATAESKAVVVKPCAPPTRCRSDPDDPAIWINRADPSKSLVLGTMKVAAPEGALAVFGLDGKLRQLLKGADRPNNVDVEYGLDLDATPTDIAVLTERLGRRLRVYAIARRRQRSCATSLPGRCRFSPARPATRARRWASACTGVRRTARSSRSSSPKAGPKQDYLWQYRLEDDGTGRVKATFVRRFGAFSGVGEIEAVAVDDELGYVYYADEGTGIHKWLADPDAPDANRELALFGTTGYEQDREGIGIYAMPGRQGIHRLGRSAAGRERLSRLPPGR